MCNGKTDHEPAALLPSHGIHLSKRKEWAMEHPAAWRNPKMVISRLHLADFIRVTFFSDSYLFIFSQERRKQTSVCWFTCCMPITAPTWNIKNLVWVSQVGGKHTGTWARVCLHTKKLLNAWKDETVATDKYSRRSQEVGRRKVCHWRGGWGSGQEEGVPLEKWMCASILHILSWVGIHDWSPIFAFIHTLPIPGPTHPHTHIPRWAVNRLWFNIEPMSLSWF